MNDHSATDASSSLSDYIKAVASAEPTPGGGSVVGTVAALAAALCEMVCNLTIGRSAYADAEPRVHTVLAQATELRARTEQFARDDEAAYRRYIAATALPRTSDEERSVRREALQTALVGAADVPLAVADACLDLLDLLETTARLGNKHVISDAEIGALLAETALRGALVNVRINARLLKSPDRAADLTNRADDLERHGRQAAERVHTALASRTS